MEATTTNKKIAFRSQLRGLTIQQRLPLVISILLIVSMSAFFLISYLGIRRSAIKTGTLRLTDLSGQISQMFMVSTTSLMNATFATSNQPNVKEYLRSGDNRKPELMEPVIQKIREDSATVCIELLNTMRNPVFHWGKQELNFAVDYGSLNTPMLNRPDSTMIGKIMRIKDSMYFPTLAPVFDGEHVIGYLVKWRLLNESKKNVDQFSALIGTNARLFIGNTDRSLWTDMIKPVDLATAADTSSVNHVLSYNDANGKPVLGVSQLIPNTSWLVRLELSQKELMSTADTYLGSMLLVGGIMLLIGVAAAWYISRRITKPLQQLTLATANMISGDYSTIVTDDRRDEIGALSRSFNTMVKQLERGKLDLENKVEETNAASEQLRNLSAHLQNIREEERIHIAREMHDELGQLLTGFKMDASWLQKRIDAQEHSEPLQDRIHAMLRGIDEAVKFVRKLAAELRPSMLDDLGLVAALEWHTIEFQKRYNIPINFHSTMENIEVPPLQATGLFRMYQESLTNIARHAKATMVVASLGIKNGLLCLSVVDDGKGFIIANDERKQTLGLLGMKERALMIGGQLEISSAPGKGTRIFITIPLPQI